MNYLIAYNNTQGVDSDKIHQGIISSPQITDWWHYLPNVYIVSTSGTAKALADSIRLRFEGLLFFVVGIDLHDYNGVLNKDAWDWISKKDSSVLKVKPVSNLLPNLPGLTLPTKPPPFPTDLNEILKRISGR